jgi:hypothetical protein
MLLVVFLNKVQQGENQQWQRPLWNKPRYLNPRSLHRAASHPTGLGHSSSVEKGPFHIKGEYSYNHRADSIAQPRILRRKFCHFPEREHIFPEPRALQLGWQQVQWRQPRASSNLTWLENPSKCTSEQEWCEIIKSENMGAISLKIHDA